MLRIASYGICASDCKCWSGAKTFLGGDNPYVKPPCYAGARDKCATQSLPWHPLIFAFNGIKHLALSFSLHAGVRSTQERSWKMFKA